MTPLDTCSYGVWLVGLNFDYWKKWFLEFPGNWHSLKRHFLRFQHKNFAFLACSNDWAMQWEAKEGPIIIQTTTSGFERKIKQKQWIRWNDKMQQLSKNIENSENIKPLMWPSLLVSICHWWMCFILYNKPTCPYFHLSKYEPDLASRSWDQIQCPEGQKYFIKLYSGFEWGKDNAARE